MPVPGSRSLVYSPFPASGTGTPAADPVALLPISRGQGVLGRSRKEPWVFRTGLVGIVEECPSRLKFAACQAAGIAQAVVRPYGEKADASDRDAQNWSQRPLPLRQWQEVEEMLRSLICAHRCCPPGLRSDHTRKQPTRWATAGAEVGGDRDRNADR